jgi:hypothetical protein
MKTVGKKLLGLLVTLTMLLLAACSQTAPTTEGLEAQGGGATCATAVPLSVGTLPATITHPTGDWYSGNSLTVPGITASVLTVVNRSSSTLQVETYSSCPPAGTRFARVPVTPGNSATIPLPGTDNFYVRVIGTLGVTYNLSYSAPIILDPCLYEPRLCYWEVTIIPDDCWVCTFDISILQEEFYRMRFTLPELGLKPGEFAKAFTFKVLTPQGKLIAQGKGNVKEAVLELSTQLPKGKYLLQVNILNQTVAKTIHANNEKYPFKFGFSRVR